MGDSEREFLESESAAEFNPENTLTHSSSMELPEALAKPNPEILLKVETPMGTIDLDSSPQTYLQEILKNCSLNQLIEIDTEMTREIKSLKNQMKKLVYSNYDKFVGASSMINRMQDKFNDMKQKSKFLAVKIDKIVQINESLNSVLHAESQEFQKLYDLDDKLGILKELVRLPIQLKLLVNSNSYLDAVTRYKSMTPFLQKYSSLSGFALIDTQCRDVLTELKKIVLEKFYSPNSTLKHLSDMGSLLLDLGEFSRSIYNYYVGFAANEILSFMSAYELHEPVDDSYAVDAEYLKFSNELSEKLSEFCSINSNFFSKMSQEDTMKRFLILDSSALAIIEKYNLITFGYIYSFLTKITFRGVEDGRTNAFKCLLNKYCEVLNCFLSSHWNLPLKSLSNQPDSIDILKKNTKLLDVSQYQSMMLDMVFEKCVKTLFLNIKELYANQTFKKDLDFTFNSLKNFHDATLLRLRELFDDYCNCKFQVLIQAQKNLNSASKKCLLTSVYKEIENVVASTFVEKLDCDVDKHEERSSVISFSATDMSEYSSMTNEQLKVLSRLSVLESVKYDFLPLLATNFKKVFSEDNEWDLISKIMNALSDEFFDCLEKKCKQFMSKFVVEESKKLNLILQPMFHIESQAIDVQLPTINSHMSLVYEKLLNCQKTILCYYELGTKLERITPLFSEEQIQNEKHVHEKNQKLSKSKKDTYWIMSRIIKQNLAELCTTIKSKSLDVSCYQQMQLNINFLHLIFDEFVRDFTALDYGIERLINEAKKNCVEPTELHIAIRAKLCHEKLSELKDKFARNMRTQS